MFKPRCADSSVFFALRAVMTQEMCKDFLAGSSNGDTAAKQRYVLYMKATSLGQAEDGIRQARLNVTETRYKIQVPTLALLPLIPNHFL